jgi:hypothetical protein
MANFAAADVDGLVRIVKRKLKMIQYRPHLIDGWGRPHSPSRTCRKADEWRGGQITAVGLWPGVLARDLVAASRLLLR